MTSWRGALSVLVGTLAWTALLLPAAAPVAAQGETLDVALLITAGRFVPDRIYLPNGGVELNFTVINDDAVNHTFTIDATSGTAINVSVAAGGRATAVFTVLSSTQVEVGGTTYTVAAGGIRFHSTVAGADGLIAVTGPDLSGGKPVLFIRINATSLTEGGSEHPRFVPDTIIVGQAGVVLNITVANVDPNPIFGSLHTFTIDTADRADSPVNLALFPGDVFQVEFTVVDATKIQVGGTTYTTEEDQGGVLFYCIPHRGDNMIGRILIGGVGAAPVEDVEHGVFLRAYWIGLVGIFATVLLTIVSYWVIKGQSVHHRDHAEHVRRGLP